MPPWVKAGFEDYQSRLPRQVELRLREINMPERTASSDIQRLKNEEGAKLLSGVASGDIVIALDQVGKCWGSEQLSEQMQLWMEEHRDVSLLVGGPDGLSTDCLNNAQQCWSLSQATLPHMLVRIIIAEQLYRAWSILQHHPYHR